MDPRDLNAGPDLQLYEKNEVPIQNKVPDSRKIKVPIEKKMRYQYKTRYRIQEKSRY